MSAHGTQASIMDTDAVVVRFSYTTDEPMAYAEIKVFPPEADIQTIDAFTDKNGVIAFVPDVQGKWKIEAHDGMGHKALIYADDSLGTGEQENTAGVPFLFRLALGFSILLNIYTVIYFFKKKAA